jgi:hypothetical protein
MCPLIGRLPALFVLLVCLAVGCSKPAKEVADQNTQASSPASPSTPSKAPTPAEVLKAHTALTKALVALLDGIKDEGAFTAALPVLEKTVEGIQEQDKKFESFKLSERDILALVKDNPEAMQADEQLSKARARILVQMPGKAEQIKDLLQKAGMARETFGQGQVLKPPVFEDDKEGVAIVKKTGPEPLDHGNRIALSFTEETQRFGIALVKLRDPRYPEKPKLLTRYENGNSNNTCLQIDKLEYIFGRESPGAGIKWKFDKKLGRKMREVRSKQDRKVVSVMRYEKEQIEVTQTVEIVVGEQTRLFDTALVTYEIRNDDDMPHDVGLRAMIDTYIGLNDGTPFLIPPTADNPKPQLIDTKVELSKTRIPQFIRVLENDNMNDPNNTVAEMGLRIKGYEPIDKLVICRWPQEWGASEVRWEWPYQAINEPAGKEKDSCVVLYWSKVNMAPKETRRMGYTYGLGRVGTAPGEEAFEKNSQGKIKLFIGPASQILVAAAYVKKADGQNCTLKLPPGVKFVKGETPAKPVKTEPGKDYAVVTWLVEASKEGKYTFDAVLDDGADAKANASVLEDSIFKP